MKMQENIAMCMYEVHRLMLASNSKDGTVYPEWEDMSDQLKTYWIAMADAALEVIQEPDNDMLKAVIDASRKPFSVDTKATWEENVVAQFVRTHTVAIEAAKMVWTIRKSKK